MCTKQKETGTYATPKYAGTRNKNRTNHKATVLLHYIENQHNSKSPIAWGFKPLLW